MNTEQKPWFHPDQLKIAEARFREGNLAGIDTRNDFGSYRVVRETGSFHGSEIDTHNDLSPLAKLTLLKRTALKDLKVQTYLDVGCGIGLTVRAAQETWPLARTYGIDVSSDAIEYARASIPGARFVCEAVDEGTTSPEPCDLITAFEFYPFTRTHDIDFQTRILKTLLSNLRPDGLLLIWHAQNNPDSLDPNVEIIRERNPSLTIKSHALPHPKVFRWVSNRRIAFVMTAIIGAMIGRQLTRRCFTVAIGDDPAM